MLMAIKGVNTFSGWAEQISVLCGKVVSKQSVFDRLTDHTVVFSRQLLESKLKQWYEPPVVSTLFKAFKNVFLHDSTTLALPDKLAKVFPGNYSKGKYKAVARIQAVYNLSQNTFAHFELASFCDNDQGASGLILGHIGKGDLVIRDLGYFVLDVFEQIKERGAHFLTRKHYGVNLYDINSGQKIDLCSLLKKRTYVDTEVSLGKANRINVRLVAVPLSENIVAERKRKAKNDRDKRLNHSKEYYELLGYAIYLTTIDQSVWSPEDIVKAYRLRWRIEIIFKSWKSHFNIQRLIHRQCNNKIIIESMIYMMLIFITLFQTVWYTYFEKRIYNKYKKYISLLKLAKFITKNIEMILIRSIELLELEKYIEKYCTYESRKGRINSAEQYYSYNS